MDAASRRDEDRLVEKDSYNQDDETSRDPAAGATPCWQVSASWEAEVSEKLQDQSHTGDSGYSTVVPQAPSEHMGVCDLLWEPNPAAEGNPLEPTAGMGSHSPGYQVKPEAPGPPETGESVIWTEAEEGFAARVKGGGDVKTLETQRGLETQSRDSESEGHREFQTHGGGQLVEVHGKTAARVHCTKPKAADINAKQEKPRRTKSNDLHRPKLKERSLQRSNSK